MNGISSNAGVGPPIASGRVMWTLVRSAVGMLSLPVVIAMSAIEPAIRFVFVSMSVLGIIATAVLGWSGAAPHFPVATSLIVWGGCGVAPLVYRAVLSGMSSLR